MTVQTRFPKGENFNRAVKNTKIFRLRRAKKHKTKEKYWFLSIRAEGALTKTARCWVLLPGVSAMCVWCVVYCSTLMASMTGMPVDTKKSKGRNLPGKCHPTTLLPWILGMGPLSWVDLVWQFWKRWWKETRNWFLLPWQIINTVGLGISNGILAVLGPVGVQWASGEVNWEHGVRLAGFGAHFGLRLG